MIRHILQLLMAFLPPTRMFALRRILLRAGSIDVAPGAKVCGGGWFYGRGACSIGRNSWLSPGCTIYTHLDAPIRIGQNCDIGHEVAFVTGSHEIGDASRRAGPGTARPIVIGDGTWIGARAIILGGTTIGSGAIIAAGAVVSRDVPAHSLAAGVPAIVKRRLD